MIFPHPLPRRALRHLPAALLLCLMPAFLFSQYQIRSPYLQNPSRAIGCMDSCAAFWLKAYDPVNGAMYTDLASGVYLYRLEAGGSVLT